MITETNKVLEMEKYTFLRSLVTVQAAFGAVLFGLSSDTIRTVVYLRAAYQLYYPFSSVVFAYMRGQIPAIGF